MMRLLEQVARKAPGALVLLAALSAPAAAWAGASGAARLTHLTFRAIDLDPGDGLVSQWTHFDKTTSISVGVSDGAEPFPNASSDGWGGLLGEGGTANASLGAAAATASSIDVARTSFAGGLAELQVDGHNGLASIFFTQSRFQIAPKTRLVVFGQLDLGVRTDGNNDIFAWGAVSFNLDATAGLPELHTFASAGPKLTAGRSASDGFSGVFGWFVDNTDPTLTRSGFLSVDIGVQSDGMGRVFSGAVPTLPLLTPVNPTAPEIPLELLPAVPEPATVVLLVVGLVAIRAEARRRRSCLSRTSTG